MTWRKFSSSLETVYWIYRASSNDRWDLSHAPFNYSSVQKELSKEAEINTEQVHSLPQPEQPSRWLLTLHAFCARLEGKSRYWTKPVLLNQDKNKTKQNKRFSLNILSQGPRLWMSDKVPAVAGLPFPGAPCTSRSSRWLIHTLPPVLLILLFSFSVHTLNSYLDFYFP